MLPIEEVHHRCIETMEECATRMPKRNGTTYVAMERKPAETGACAVEDVGSLPPKEVLFRDGALRGIRSHAALFANFMT